MGGMDKTRLLVDGLPLLDHTLDGFPAHVPILVVGLPRPTARRVTFLQESPAFDGPAAALATAVHEVRTPLVGLVGGDMPDVGPLITTMAAEWSGEDALVATDASGRQQPLCSIFSTQVLSDALARMGSMSNRSLREVVDLLDVRPRHLDHAESALLRDVDQPEDLRGTR